MSTQTSAPNKPEFDTPPARRLSVTEFFQAMVTAGGKVEPTPGGGVKVTPIKQASLPPRRTSGRAPRPATNGRTRGSRRGTRAGASSDDDPSEPPPRGCECGCGADLTGRRPQTRFATDACRKRAERADFAQTAEGEHTVRFLVENSRLWQEIAAERSWGLPA